MKPTPRLRSFLAALGGSILALSSASAATFYWDSDSTTAGFGALDGIWGTSLFWGTSSAGTAATANTTITNFDDINFGTLANAYSGTVTLNGDKVARGVTFAGSSNVVLKGNGTARRLTLGNGGLTMNDTSTVTMGDGVAGNNLLIGLGAFGQTWTNNSSGNLSILNTAATFTRSAGGTIAFNQTGAGVFSMSTTVLPNEVSGIVGPWAFFGTGTSTRYAFNNSGTIAGYSGGTAAADAEAFTSSSTNYDFSTTGTTTLTASRTANTVRYDGTGNVIDLGASGADTLTTNGILAVGASGILTIQRTGGTGTLVAGSTGTNSELVIAGPQNISISAPISNGLGASALTYRGTGTLTLSGGNTYTGANTVSSGTLVLGSASALGTTGKALNVNGSGTLDLSSFDLNAGAFNGDSASAIVTNSAVGDASELTVGTGNTAGDFRGVISGNLRLIKSGTNTLRLANANTYTEGTTFNAGTITEVGSGSLGSGLITFAGNSALQASRQTSEVWSNAIHIDPGVTGQLNAINQFYRFSTTGALSGDGTLWATATDNGNGNIILSNTGNTFTGTVEIGSTGKVGNLQISSLLDSANPIKLGATTGAGNLTFTGTAASQTYANRVFTLSGTTGGGSITNNGAAANIVTISQNLAITANGAKILTLGGSNVGLNTFAGSIGNSGAGATALTKANGGTWVLSNTANTYTGITTVSGGILVVTKLDDGSSNSSIGASTNAASNLLLANGTTLRYTGSGDSTDRSFTINVSSNNHGAILDASGTGAVNFTNTASPAYGTAAQPRTLTLTGTNTGNNTLAANLANNGSGAVAIDKTGIGTWVLSGTNANTGNTTISGGGELVLDYGTNDDNKIAGVLTLSNGAGDITLRDGSHLEAVTSLTIGTGGGHTSITREVGSTAKLAFGALTRSQNQGVTMSLAANSLATTSSAVVNGILTGGITVGSNWAKVSSGDIVALETADYTDLTAAGTTNTVNYELTGSLSRGAASVNSLRIVGDGDDQTLTITSGNLTPSPLTGTLGNGAAGGILYAGGGNNNYTITGPGNIQAQNSNQELIIHTHTGTLTVDMAVTVGSSILTKSGAGTLALTKAGTYTGATRVNQGTLLANNTTGNATGTGAVTVTNGAALGGTGTVGGSTTIAAGGGLTFNLTTASGSHDKLELAATKTLTFSGASTLTITSSGGTPGTGTYTLLTAPGGITGSVPTTVNLPIGWTAAAPQIVGNDLVINITSTGGGLTAYQLWAGGAAFNDDANGDGVSNGMAFLLGASGPTVSALDKLPTVSQSGGGLVLNFNCLPTTARGGAQLRVAHSTNLASWTATTNVVPDSNVPDGFVSYVIVPGPLGPPALNNVTATIGSGAAAGGKLFGRLQASE